MGSVYKIEHVLTKRIEAMKVLPIGIGSSPEDVQRFEREIEVQARLHHRNIVAVYNALRDEHSIALIMEYVEGESIERILERGRLPLQTAVDYAGQVLDALAYAHDNGVIHRDVKPANIIVTSSGTAKLMDFGLALTVNDIRLTGAGVAVGSAWYMSPEQVKSDRIDARTDIYATGAVLHEMLTGGKMFDADGSFAVMRAQMETIPKAPSTLNADVPAALDEVLAKALAKDPAARLQTAGEFGRVLRTSVAGKCSAVAGPETTPAHKTRNRLLPARAAMPSALVLVTLLAIGAAMVWQRTKRGPGGVSASRNAASAPAPAIAQGSAIDSKASTSTSTSSAPEPRSPTPRVKSSSRPREQSSGEAPTRTTPSPAGEFAASAEPDVDSQTPVEGKSPRKGNRFVRALSRLNPFHKGVKNESVEPAKTVPTESTAK
jgi:serine/threonine-protein kinase